MPGFRIRVPRHVFEEEAKVSELIDKDLGGWN